MPTQTTLETDLAARCRELEKRCSALEAFVALTANGSNPRRLASVLRSIRRRVETPPEHPHHAGE